MKNLKLSDQVKFKAIRYLNYARRSSDESSKRQIQSIEDQLADTRRVQRDLGLNVIEEMTESKSAKEPGRPVFNRMISLLQNGTADAVLVWKLDRLARNPIDAATLRWMMRQGTLKEIRTPHQVYGPDDNAVIAAVENAMAEQYIIDLKKGVERGMKSKCEKGGYPLLAPAGYRNNRLTQEVEVDEERFALLQKAWKLLLSGGYSVPQIHDLLVNQWGYRNRPSRSNAGGKLARSTLFNIFHNPFYKGSFLFQGTEYVHKYPRMVTQGEWEETQKIIARRAFQKPVRLRFAFTGCITCASCGFWITAEKSKGHIYYHCNNTLGICTKKGIREEEIERHIAHLLGEIELPETFETMALRVLEDLRTQKTEAIQQIADTQRETAVTLKRQKDALLGLFLQGLLTQEEYAAKKDDLNQQETHLTLNEGEQEQVFDANHQAVSEAARFVVDAPRNFMQGGLDVEEKRKIARNLAEGYVLNNGGLQVALHPMFEKVRYHFRNDVIQEPIIEPSETGSSKQKTALDEPFNPIWCAILEEYRNTELKRNSFVRLAT